VNRPQKTPTIEDAQVISNRLVKSFSGIDAVLLFGSVARGDANEWSDIDLLVTGSDPSITPARLRRALSRGGTDRISLVYYPTPVFRKHYRERALFIAHLKREGVALFDRLNLLRGILNKPFAPAVDVSEGIRAQVKKLSAYSDPKRFNNNFLFCLAHLYSIGKGVVMLGLAKKGVLEFNRESAFRRFIGLHPDLARETNKVARLRPFYRLVTRRQPERLPFSYKRAHRQAQDAVAAIQTLAERASAT
jgi:predicted nucleotidyltransferase